MTIRTNRARASVLVLAVAIAIGAFLAAGTTATAKDTALPRNGTLYTSGTAWGPFTNFNPLRSGYATGVLGLHYETLFRYDPLTDRFIPWLATNGGWNGTTYVLTVRRGDTIDGRFVVRAIGANDVEIGIVNREATLRLSLDGWI